MAETRDSRDFGAGNLSATPRGRNHHGAVAPAQIVVPHSNCHYLIRVSK
jgi:hypothetical protein